MTLSIQVLVEFYFLIKLDFNFKCVIIKPVNKPEDIKMQGSYADGKEKFQQRKKDKNDKKFHEQDKAWRQKRKHRHDEA